MRFLRFEVLAGPWRQNPCIHFSETCRKVRYIFPNLQIRTCFIAQTDMYVAAGNGTFYIGVAGRLLRRRENLSIFAA